MVNSRIVSKPIVDTDEFLYLKMTDLTLGQDDKLEIVDTVNELNEDILENPGGTFDKEISISIEATDGGKNYKLRQNMTKDIILANRIRSENALNVIKDDEIFVKFMYKFLIFGTYDDIDEFGMVVMVNENTEFEINIVQKKIEEFAIKLYTIALSESNIVVDLFEWFNLMSIQKQEQFKMLNYMYKLNKINEYKITKLVDDNKEIMKNYDMIRESTKKFNLILNAKKQKILELSATDEEFAKNLNIERKKIDKYDILHKSSFNLSSDEEIKEEDERHIPKKIKIKQEDSTDYSTDDEL